MAVIIGTGSFFLALSLAVNVIALLVPYWAIFGNSSVGLWGECSCTWLFENEALQTKGKPEDWFRAAQGLYTIGVGIIIICLFVVFIVACCTETKGGTAMLVAGILLVIAAVCIAVATVVFGIYGAEDGNWKLSLSGASRIGWGLWLGVSGVVVCVVAAIIHIHQGRPRH